MNKVDLIDPITRRRLPTYLTGLRSLTDWHQDAACSGSDTELFFPEQKGLAQKAQIICESCPVITNCLAHAQEQPERFGVWGGVTAKGRGWSHAGKPLPVTEPSSGDDASLPQTTAA
ncbi:WhiB family transcriptional regulator [Streptomyces sp. 3211]|uniref:WhiB family transcriptional regulator n=1 Tax=Streptomyces sp. 3211 TaxID=1964449 RepID=UPI0009A4C712|nr:WhiB family transcriptional regulator [Streptomyces sp. 3211]